jgi:hypothetical protein
LPWAASTRPARSAARALPAHGYPRWSRSIVELLRGRKAAPYFPTVAGRVSAKHDPHVLAVEGGVLLASVLQPARELMKFVADLNGDVSPGCRPMVRVFAQMDLFAVVTFEPSCAAGEFRRWRDFAVAKDVDQKLSLGLRLTHWNAEIHMMESEHFATLPPAEKDVVESIETIPRGTALHQQCRFCVHQLGGRTRNRQTPAGSGANP